MEDFRVRFCGVRCSRIATYHLRFPNGHKLTSSESLSTLSMEEVMKTLAAAPVINGENRTQFAYPGVWCKIDVETGEILDLMTTANISKEYQKVSKWLKKRSSAKYEELAKRKLEMKVLYECLNYSEALGYELAWAKLLSPKYWELSPSQLLEI